MINEEKNEVPPHKNAGGESDEKPPLYSHMPALLKFATGKAIKGELRYREYYHPAWTFVSDCEKFRIDGGFHLTKTMALKNFTDNYGDIAPLQ